MKFKSLYLVLVLALAACVLAQEKKKGIVAEGGEPDERASARVLYWDQDANAAAGQFAINYGRPVWKKDYEDPAKFDAMTRGKVWRMGSNFWTNLDSQLHLKISGKDVPPGYYYLGLQRSADGTTWSLAFFDPARIRAAHVDAFDIAKAHWQFQVPMKLEESSNTAEKLTITLARSKINLYDVTLRVAWGKTVLTAPIKVVVGIVGG